MKFGYIQKPSNSAIPISVIVYSVPAVKLFKGARLAHITTFRAVARFEVDGCRVGHINATAYARFVWAGVDQGGPKSGVPSVGFLFSNGYSNLGNLILFVVSLSATAVTPIQKVSSVALSAAIRELGSVRISMKSSSQKIQHKDLTLSQTAPF